MSKPIISYWHEAEFLLTDLGTGETRLRSRLAERSGGFTIH